MFGETTFTYFVSGRAYYRTYSDAAGYAFPGLVDSVSLAVDQTEFNLTDHTEPGGGNYDQVRRINSVTGTINFRELKPTVLAEALWGASTQNTTAAVTDEVHTVTKGAFVPLNHGGTISSVSVTDDDTAPNAISADNYEVRPGGLWILENAPDLNDDDGILVSYTYPTYSRIQALTRSAPELQIWFDGENEARSDKNVRVKIHRARLGAPAELALLSADDFSALSIDFEVLKDASITGAGLSKYFYVDVEN